MKRGDIIAKCVVATFVLISIAISDIRTYRVNNWLILIGTVAGLVFSIADYGIYGIGSFFIGYMTPILLLFFFFYLKMFGAGDIKTFAVIGGLYGIPFALNAVVYSIFIGGALSIIVMIRSKNYYHRFSSFIHYVSRSIYNKKIVAYNLEEAKENNATIHFTIAILGGFFLAYRNPIW